ncbi:MAG: VOC family protein [Candidatus Binataceae bacterium]|nr:VOC family protein [Candidatus Binataceae bacterium]
MSIAHSNQGNGTKVRPLPMRLHHNAYVCHDLEQTRKFYEDVLGWPLISVWRERDFIFNEDLSYCHLFFQIADGGCLAFFKFADDAMQEKFAQYGPHSPFVHLALKADAAVQEEVKRRLEAAGYKTDVIDHGYCRSLYFTDPNGLNLEFAVDHPDWDKIVALRTASAHDDLKKWIAGDHSSNNDWRPPETQPSHTGK